MDWLSFSYHTPVSEPTEGWFYDVINSLEERSQIAYVMLDEEQSVIGNGRRPYAMSYGNRYIKIFMSPTVEWSLVEISGSGCELLTSEGLAEELAIEVSDRATRIDFAVDIRVGDENRVSEFVDAGYSDRFKTRSDVVSGSGVTHYIGSRTSERLCRVYQYKPPHPRCDLLRIEFELKGDRAKQAANMLRSASVQGIAQSLIDAYGFKSGMLGAPWVDNPGFEPLRGKQRHNNTIAWIHKQVVPAVKKLVHEGVIVDLEEFLRDTFLREK